jgi:hypothetical protein
MPEGSSGGNGKKPGNGAAHSSSDPAVVTLHTTLDEIDRMLHGEQPMCDFEEVGREYQAMGARSEGLRASLAELASHGLARRRRSRRSAVG